MPSKTLFVELLTHTPQPDAIIAMAAKLCYSGAGIGEHRAKTTAEDNAKFLQKLIDMGHHSPIEHVSFTFGAEGVSRALLAQLTRHRIASFSVQSQRYVKQTGNGGFSYIIPPSIISLGAEAVRRYESQMDTMREWYDGWSRELGESGKEDARFVLPNAAETRLMMTMNARELMHFFKMRCCMRAQWEIRAMAFAMLGHAYNAAPNLFKSAGPSCAGSGCSEGGMSCGKSREVTAVIERLQRFTEQNGARQDFAAELSAWACENSKI